MKPMIVVFTDLDGTLLDHKNYSYTAAEPCLHYLREHHIPLIFTSSKTAIEIEELCIQSKFFYPFIAENGGLLSVPENYFSQNNQSNKQYVKKIIGTSRDEINQVLKKFEGSYKFKSFKQMSTEEIIKHTGLSKQQALWANLRDATEPLLWLDKKSNLPIFANQLTQHNLTLVSGGRFQHVMGNHDKATTMSLLIEQFSIRFKQQIISIALGDSPNDLKMLENASYGIVIPNPNAPKMCINNHGNLRYSKHSGPQGWNNTLLELIKELSE